MGKKEFTNSKNGIKENLSLFILYSSTYLIYYHVHIHERNKSSSQLATLQIENPKPLPISFLACCDSSLGFNDSFEFVTQPLHHAKDMTQGQFLSRVKLVFLLTDWLPYQGKKKTVCFSQSLSEKRWIHAFCKGISVKWNANSFVQVWTWVPNSISKNSNHYTNCIFIKKSSKGN